MLTADFMVWIAKLGLIIANAILLQEQGSCDGRCDSPLDKNKTCQCNSPCIGFGDCCSDYESLCAGPVDTGPLENSSCDTLTVISEKLWASDINGFQPSEYTVNYQTQVPDKTRTDHSNETFFTFLNESRFSEPTYQAFLALLDNYYPEKGDRENATLDELAENDEFLDAILNTTVMENLLEYLICEGIVSDQNDLRAKLTEIWFDFYPRSGSSDIPDTSGFEHIFVGEYKTSATINGFHNWIAFYEYEKAGDLNYFGYVNKAEPDLVGASFDWNNRQKTLGSFFIGVSPELDMALYSLCFLTNPGKSCKISLDGNPLTIMSYSNDGHIATAFASL